MRDLKKSDRNRLTLTDTASGEQIVVYYSTPTASQMRAYRQESIRRRGKKVVVENFDPALKYGLEILTGFEDGAFGFDGVPISADPASPAFREDWKALLKETASDIVTAVAYVAFDGVRAGSEEEDIEFGGDGEEGADVLPLQKS